MSSFYGGKQGRTYHIVARYDSVAAMIQAFQGGGAYTEANYGEYVIIDTIMNLNKKADPENGLLFRRGFDYNELVGQKPNKEDFLDQNNNLDKQAWAAAWSAWIRHPGGGAIYVGQIVGPQGESPEVKPVEWNDDFATNAVKGSFSKGKEIDEDTGQISYNDDIRVGYFTVKDSDGNIIGAQLAFDIPSAVIEAEVVNDDAYVDARIVEAEISREHPFYYKWDFTIPKGKQGRGIDEIKLETAFEGQEFSHANYNDVIDGDQYLTYTDHDYSETAEGAITAHLGRWPYRVINGIESISRERVYFPWGESSTAQIGDIYNFNLADSSIVAACIKDGEVDNQVRPSQDLAIIGKQFYSPDIDQSRAAKWRVMRIPQTAAARAINIDYTAGPDDNIGIIRNIDYVTADETGNIYIHYSDQQAGEQPYYLITLNTLKDVRLEDGKIVVEYYNKETDTFPIRQITNAYLNDSVFTIEYIENGIEYQDAFPLKQIDRIFLKNQEDITQPQRFYVSYQGEATPDEQVSEPINTILDVKRYGDNLVCLYSDPATRNRVQREGRENVDWYKFDWTDPNTGTEYSERQGNQLVWKSFGYIGSQFHVQGNYTYQELEEDYKDGLGVPGSGTEERAGWVVSVITEEAGENIIKLYAFDYNDTTTEGKYTFPDDEPTHWYEVMSVAQSVASNPKTTVLVSEIGQNDKPLDDDSDLKQGGLWFVVTGGHDQ